MFVVVVHHMRQWPLLMRPRVVAVGHWLLLLLMLRLMMILLLLLELLSLLSKRQLRELLQRRHVRGVVDCTVAIVVVEFSKLSVLRIVLLPMLLRRGQRGRGGWRDRRMVRRAVSKLRGREFGCEGELRRGGRWRLPLALALAAARS